MKDWLQLFSAVMVGLEPYVLWASRPFVSWLRANPLGPALTVVFAGLVWVFLLPWVSLLAFKSSKLVLVQVCIGVVVIPYVLHRVHDLSLRPFLALWILILALALWSSPAPLEEIRAFELSAHITGWFMFGFLPTAGISLYLIDARERREFRERQASQKEAERSTAMAEDRKSV
ncbi:MAG: hypothetical protein AB7G93_21235 [Bdellovibrionales bacterium]